MLPRKWMRSCLMLKKLPNTNSISIAYYVALHDLRCARTKCTLTLLDLYASCIRWIYNCYKILNPGIHPTSSLQSSATKYSLRFLLLVLFNSGFSIFSITSAFAQEQKVPRFAIVKSNQVNARTGPGTSYPIEWVFVSKGEPIKIVAEFEQWRKVEDVENKGGWVHSSVLSPKRSVVIIGNNIQKLFAHEEMSSRIVAKLEPGLRCALDKCKNHWCKIKCDGYKGWIEAANIWGILKAEEGGIN